jgi:hypothetical protein
VDLDTGKWTITGDETAPLIHTHYAHITVSNLQGLPHWSIHKTLL